MWLTYHQKPAATSQEKWHGDFRGSAELAPWLTTVREATGLVVDNVGITSKSSPGQQPASMTHWPALPFHIQRQKRTRMYVPLPTVSLLMQRPLQWLTGMQCVPPNTDSGKDSPETTSARRAPPTLKPLRSRRLSDGHPPHPHTLLLFLEHLLNKAVPEHTNPLLSFCSGGPNLGPLNPAY